MAIWQAVNVQTGAPEKAKFNVSGDVSEIWSVALTTALAAGDTILGPLIPANTFVNGISVDVDQLDTGGGITFEVGTAAVPGQFIATGNTGARTGGYVIQNVAATLGYSPVADTQVIATIQARPTTPRAGNFRFLVQYTASP